MPAGRLSTRRRHLYKLQRMQNERLKPEESLALITQMIGRAKNAYKDSGISSMMWGLVIAICSLVRFVELSLGSRLPFDIFLLTFIAIIPQIFIGLREKKMRQARTYEDTVMSYVWWGFGICVFLTSFTLNMIWSKYAPLLDGWKQAGNGIPFKLYDYQLSFFLIIYGLPTFITGGVMKFRPMLYGGILCWVCCIVSLFTPVKTDLLLTALAALCAWFIPGVIMQVHHRKAKHLMAQQDV
jgi:hypothetical protein